MHKIKNKSAGLMLIEVIIYSSILAILITIMMQTYFNVLEIYAKDATSLQTYNEFLFIFKKIRLNYSSTAFIQKPENEGSNHEFLFNAIGIDNIQHTYDYYSDDIGNIFYKIDDKNPLMLNTHDIAVQDFNVSREIVSNGYKITISMTINDETLITILYNYTS